MFILDSAVKIGFYVLILDVADFGGMADVSRKGIGFLVHFVHKATTSTASVQAPGLDCRIQADPG